MTTFYVDVSQHDLERRGHPLDWVAIRQYTSPVMIARATYGDPQGVHYPTYHHAEFHTDAAAAGFTTRGSYHNLVTGDQASINRQVDWLRREMDSVDAVWAMLDVERYTELVTNNMWPRWDDVAQFCDRWHAVDSRVLTAYIPGWLYGSYYAGRDIAALGVPLVESDYGSNPSGLPAAAYAARGGDTGRGWQATGNLTPTIWQFSSNCAVPGASDKTDINAYRGSTDELRALLEGVDMPLSKEEGGALTVSWQDAAAMLHGWDTAPGGGGPHWAVQTLKAQLALLTKIAEKVDIDPAELDAIRAAAQEGAAAAAATLVDQVVTAIGERLPATGTLTRDDVVSAVEEGTRAILAGGLVVTPK